MIGHESSTVVALVGWGDRKLTDIEAPSPPGKLPEPLLAELDRSANISVVRPPADEPDAVESATMALRQAAQIVALRTSPCFISAWVAIR